MRDSKFVEYLDKLRTGQLTRSEGAHLYALVRGFIQALDRRFFKVSNANYKPDVLDERILAFYEYMRTAQTTKPVVYAFQSFRRKYAQVLAVLSLRRLGVAIPIKDLDTSKVRYVVMHQTIRRKLNRQPSLSDVLGYVADGNDYFFTSRRSTKLMSNYYGWYESLPWVKVNDKQVN